MNTCVECGMEISVGMYFCDKECKKDFESKQTIAEMPDESQAIEATNSATAKEIALLQNEIDLLRDELKRLRVENESLKAKINTLESENSRMRSENDWITLPCAPERLPKVGDVVVQRDGSSYEFHKFRQWDSLNPCTESFKIIERAKQ